MSTKPEHPTSTNPTIAELNQLVYETFPPKWNETKHGSWWGYGRLYYLGDQLVTIRVIGQPSFIDPHWMLDGITPVRADCVLSMLVREGRDVAKFELFFAHLEAEREDAFKRGQTLRASASAKLTAEEREACGL